MKNDNSKKENIGLTGYALIIAVIVITVVALLTLPQNCGGSLVNLHNQSLFKITQLTYWVFSY